MKQHNIVFGPVASRRLGRSLGVDLLMDKICCQDCIYCEVGKTRELTCTRKEYVPLQKIKDSLTAALKEDPQLDYVTFSGEGEPTLSSVIGEVIRFIKQNFPQYRVCLLTNGMLLGNPDLQQEISGADLVIPSLDASCAGEFAAVNRPAEDISFEEYLKGLEEFSHRFRGRIFLEIFIVPGINDSPESVSRFAGIVSRLKVDRIQLNSLDRPGTESNIPAVPEDTACRVAAALSPFADVEIVSRNGKKVFPKNAAPEKSTHSAGLPEKES